jgi:4-hydroxybenzoate polyprenyltransferase
MSQVEPVGPDRSALSETRFSPRLRPPARLWAPLAIGFHTGLCSTLFVCGFQPFLAMLLLGEVRPRFSLAMLLFVWMMYLVDRMGDHPEDREHDEQGGGASASFVRQNRAGCRLLLLGLCGSQLALIWQEPQLLKSIAVSLACSVFYMVELPFVGKRVKQLPFVKCFYLAACSLVITASFTPGLASLPWARLAAPLGVAYALYFLNYSLYDVKDVAGDTRANIRTFAAAMPLAVFLNAHVALALSTLLVALAILPHTAALVLSSVCLFHAGASLWLRRRELGGVTCAVIDSGYGLLMVLGALLL